MNMNNTAPISNKERCPLFDSLHEDLGWTKKDWYDQMILEYIRYLNIQISSTVNIGTGSNTLLIIRRVILKDNNEY